MPDAAIESDRRTTDRRVALITPGELEAMFRNRGEMHDGALCLKPADAIEFVQVCETNDLAVIGVDSFLSERDAMVPSLHLVADFPAMSDTDWIAFRRLCNAESEHFITALDERADMMVTLSIAPAGAWRAL